MHFSYNCKSQNSSPRIRFSPLSDIKDVALGQIQTRGNYTKMNKPRVVNYCRANYATWHVALHTHAHTLFSLSFSSLYPPEATWHMAVWGSLEADLSHTHTHTHTQAHLPGIWMSQGHRWTSAHCTGTEHSCPSRQQWAPWTPEQMSGSRCEGGRNLQHTPAHTHNKTDRQTDR